MSDSTPTSDLQEVEVNFKDDCDICHRHIRKLAQHQSTHSSSGSKEGQRKQKHNRPTHSSKYEVIDIDIDSDSENDRDPDPKASYSRNINELDLQCERECETCEKYTQTLYDHVSRAHGGQGRGQEIHDPILIEVPTNSDPSSVEMNCEMEDAETMDCATEADIVVERPDSDCDRLDDRTRIHRKSETQKTDVLKTGNEWVGWSGSVSDLPRTRVRIARGQRATHWRKGVDENSRVVTNRKSSPRKLQKGSRKGGRPPKKVKESSKSESETSQRKTRVKKVRARSRSKSDSSADSEDEKRFDCKVCVMKFSRKCDLGSHMRRHNAVDVEQLCEECGKKFPTKAKLSQHMKSHSGIKHDCETCGKCFNWKNDLVRHVKNIHGEKKEKKEVEKKEFICKICRRVLGSWSTLRKHYSSFHPQHTTQ